MKYLSIMLALAAFSVAGTIPALSRTIQHHSPALSRAVHHPTKHAGPLYLYYGRSGVYYGRSAVGPGCLSPASPCAGEASQR
jgi:hypothetical protein